MCSKVPKKYGAPVRARRTVNGKSAQYQRAFVAQRACCHLNSAAHEHSKVCACATLDTYYTYKDATLATISISVDANSEFKMWRRINRDCIESFIFAQKVLLLRLHTETKKIHIPPSYDGNDI
jgi:hypothetical protein